MKVLLVRPQAPNLLSFVRVLDCEPLELEYLYTALAEQGIEGVIFDGMFDREFPEVLRREKPDIVSVTGYITQQELMVGYCAAAKEWNPRTVTVVGGVHAQLNHQNFYRDCIDYVFRSESAEDYAALVALTAAPVPEKALAGINGLCYRAGGEFRENPLLPVDIDRLPIPDRTHFSRTKHRYRYLDLTEVASVKTAFSCPHSCNFCYCTRLAGGKYRARDIDRVVEEIAGLEAENVQIVDDDFLADTQRVRRFVELILARGIRKTYLCYARADAVCENPDLVRALAEIGFRYFLVGLEAVTDGELEGMNKKTSVEMNLRCVRIIHETSARCIALMIAPLGADRAYFDALYRWVKHAGLQHVTVSIFTPIPGTPLYEAYRERITSKQSSDWDFLHLVLEPEKLTRRQFYREYRRLFLRLYRIAKKTGIYSFMDLAYYRDLLLEYLGRKIRGR